MKRNITISLFLIFLFHAKIFGQTIAVATDSIPSLLCKKWEVNYAMIGTMKIGQLPGAANTNYEFKANKTFILTGDTPAETSKGTWKIDEQKKIVKLVVDGKNNANVISLNSDELVIESNTKNINQKKSDGDYHFYKVKSGT